MNAERRMVALLFCILHSAFCIPLVAGSRAAATHAAVATASPYATQIGLHVLQDGGNAADASVAIAFALAVAKPQSGNIGGGGFLTYYDAASHGVWTLDFREAAPAAAKSIARSGAASAAIPGTVAGLAALHERFGSKKWEGLVAPAAALARGGVKVDFELANAIKLVQQERKIEPFAGERAEMGATLVQGDLAATLDRIAVNGAREFYDGETARRIADDGRAAGGAISLRDLREYKPIWRAPMRIVFRGCEIYTVAPPSAGGMMIAATLNILGAYNLAAGGFQSPASLHLIAEAERRAAIDRDKYLGDPAYTRIPMRDLLSADRAAQWRASINPKRVTPTMTLTEPATAAAESTHTTHFTVADAKGNVAVVTVTLGDDFGSGFVVAGCGVLLNNSIKDFTPLPASPNAVGGGKRPASSMSPTIVLRGGKPLLALGTPGGGAIPAIIVNVLLNVVVYGKSLDDAIAAPRYDQQAAPEEMSYELTFAPKATIDALAALAHGLRQSEAIGDVQAVMFAGDKLIAVSDPRHGGAAGAY
jgi:gamma-glutamyltranspeptidase/glutathione hydrolase